MDTNAPTPPIEIPFASLSDSAREGVIDDFIAREGTDYGVVEASQEKKREDIRRQIGKGHVKLIFDPDTESVTLVSDREWRLRSQL